MDPSIVFNGYENPDAFMIRYKTLERQQQHFNVSLFYFFKAWIYWYAKKNSANGIEWANGDEKMRDEL